MRISCLDKRYKEFNDEVKCIFKPVVTLFLIYGIAFCSIFRANFNYYDDLGRAYAGYHGWLDWSRWFTEAFSNFIHADWYLSDVSPLPQLIACMFMATGGILLLRFLNQEKRITLWSIIAVSLTGLTPYFLGIISYKYDSPYMAFSFLVSVIPFYFKEKNKFTYIIVSFLCVLLMCTSYQSSSGIYPMIVLFLCVFDINAGGRLRKNLIFVMESVIAYLTALLFFWFFLMLPNNMSVFSIKQLLPNMVNKYLTFYRYLFHDFKLIWVLLMLTLLIMFLFIFVASSRLKKGLALILGLGTLFFSSILCFGVYLVIDQDKYDPRAMYALGVLLAIIAAYISFSEMNFAYKLSYLLLAWCFFSFAFTYGNALSYQKEYRDYRMQLVVQDLNNLDAMQTKETKKVTIIGNINYAPVINQMSEGYDILERLIPSGFGTGIWDEYYFRYYYGLPHIEQDKEYDGKEYPVLIKTMCHEIRGDNNHIVIILK